MIKRNDNIDFFRGVAALWIIFIHTCFWSGSMYVPVWLQSLSLIIDVPLFVFISGMTFNFSNSFFKTIKSLCKIWFKWLEFLIIYFLIILFFDFKHFNLSSVVKAIFFNFNGDDILMVVNGSLWFIFMFFVVCIIGSFIIYVYNKYFSDLSNFKYILIISFILYGMSLYNNNFIFISTINLMYIFLYLLGYYLYHFHFKNLKQFLIVLIIIIFSVLMLLKFNDYNFLNMQSAKFVAHINYLVYSLISIVCVVYFKDKIYIKNTILNFIGKNALVFYFCQGIGGSLIYKIYPLFEKFPGFVKLVLMFGSNFCITCSFSLFLIFLSNKYKNNLKSFLIHYLKYDKNDRKLSKKML